jgi:hypothetical protein
LFKFDYGTKDEIKADAKFKRVLTEVHAQDLAQRRSIDEPLAERAMQAINTLETNKKYAKDYEQYVDAAVYATDAEKLSFIRALAGFKDLMEKAFK